MQTRNVDHPYVATHILLFLKEFQTSNYISHPWYHSRIADEVMAMIFQFFHLYIKILYKEVKYVR